MQLSWLIGTWEGAHSGGTYRERWQRAAHDPSRLEGNSEFRNASGTVVETESLYIATVDNAIDYVASPSGQSTTRFRLHRSSQSEAVFENPTHDFPTRIVYRLESPDQLLAYIEGPSTDGGTRRIEFRLQRVSVTGIHQP